MIIERLNEMAREQLEQLTEEVKRRLGLETLEDDETKLEIRMVSHEFFDILMTCKACSYSVRIATLPAQAPDAWQEIVASNAFHSLKRFREHRCMARIAVK